MLGAETPLGFSFDPKNGLTIEIPESVRQNLPCEHAWTFVVNEANIVH